MKAKLIRNAVIKGELKLAGKSVDVTKELHEELVELGVVRDPNAPEVQEATSQVQDEAKAKAEGIVKDAEAEAARIVEEAKATAEKVVTEAEERAKVIDAEVKAKTETQTDKK